MRSLSCVAAAFVPACVLALACLSASASYDDGGALAGDWVGESICTKDASAACRDEKVVYHIKRPDADGNAEIVADKIVDGKLEYMGTIRLKYDAQKGTLKGDFESPRYKGVWEFSIKGDTMEGTLTVLPEKNVVRRISVKKDAAHKWGAGARG